MDPKRRIDNALATPLRRRPPTRDLDAKTLFKLPPGSALRYDFDVAELAIVTAQFLHATADESFSVHAEDPYLTQPSQDQVWVPRHMQHRVYGLYDQAPPMFDAWLVHMEKGVGLALTTDARLLTIHAVAMPDWCACRNTKPGVLPGLRRRLTRDGDLCVGLRPDQGKTVWVNVMQALTNRAVDGFNRQ